MKGKPIQNLAASVYARLLKRTEPGDEQFQFVLMRYGGRTRPTLEGIHRRLQEIRERKSQEFVDQLKAKGKVQIFI